MVLQSRDFRKALFNVGSLSFYVWLFPKWTILSQNILGIFHELILANVLHQQELWIPLEIPQKFT